MMEFKGPVRKSTSKRIWKGLFPQNLRHQWTLSSNQVKSGIQVIKRVITFFKAATEKTDLWTKEIAKLKATEAIKADMKRDEMKGLVEMVLSLEQLVETGNRQQIELSAQIKLKVIQPLESFCKQAEALLKQLLLDEKKVSGAYQTMRSDMAKLYQECIKIWQQLQQIYQEQQREQQQQPPQFSFSGVSNALFSNTQKKEEQTRQKAFKTFQKYEAAIIKANLKIKEYHTKELPHLLRELEALENRRLVEVNRALITYAELQRKQILPLERLTTRLSKTVTKLEPSKEIQKFVQSVLDEHGKPPQVDFLRYDLPCPAQDLTSTKYLEGIDKVVKEEKEEKKVEVPKKIKEPRSPVTNSPAGSGPLPTSATFTSVNSDTTDSQQDEDEEKDDEEERKTGLPLTKKGRGRALQGKGFLHLRDSEGKSWVLYYVQIDKNNLNCYNYTQPQDPECRPEFVRTLCPLNGARIRRYGWEDYGKKFCFGVGSRDEDEVIMTAEGEQQAKDWLFALSQVEHKRMWREEASSEEILARLQKVEQVLRSLQPGFSETSTTSRRLSDQEQKEDMGRGNRKQVEQQVVFLSKQFETMIRIYLKAEEDALPRSGLSSEGDLFAHWDLMASVDKNYWPILKGVLDPNMDIPLKILNHVKSENFDKIARAFVNVYEVTGNMSLLFETVISREIDSTSHEGTIFRDNSVASKMLTYFARLEAETYLPLMLGEATRFCIMTPLDFELNSRKMSCFIASVLRKKREESSSSFTSSSSSPSSSTPSPSTPSPSIPSSAPSLLEASSDTPRLPSVPPPILTLEPIPALPSYPPPPLSPSPDTLGVPQTLTLEKSPSGEPLPRSQGFSVGDDEDNPPSLNNNRRNSDSQIHLPPPSSLPPAAAADSTATDTKIPKPDSGLGSPQKNTAAHSRAVSAFPELGSGKKTAKTPKTPSNAKSYDFRNKHSPFLSPSGSSPKHPPPVEHKVVPSPPTSKKSPENNKLSVKTPRALRSIFPLTPKGTGERERGDRKSDPEPPASPRSPPKEEEGEDGDEFAELDDDSLVNSASSIRVKAEERKKKTKERILQELEKLTLDFDISLLSDEELQLKINARALEYALSLFLDSIINSLSYAPWRLRIVAHHIQSIVARKYPKASTTSVGGFLFLRLVCPFLLTSSSWAVAEDFPLPRKAQRNLVLVTKMLQNLSNGVIFSDSKEKYMTPLNDFLEKNMLKVKTFLDDFANPDPRVPEISDSPSSRRDRADGASEDFEVLLNALSAITTPLMSALGDEESVEGDGL